MKFRGLLAAVVVLAALGGFLYWSQRHPNAMQPKTAETPELPPLVKVSDQAITGLMLTERGSAPITLEMREPGRWVITTPITAPADDASVAHILSNLAHIRTQAIIEDHATNLSGYGLANPSLTLDITEKGKETARLILGDRTPTSDGAYAMVPGDAHVYTIPYFMDEAFNQPLDSLRDKRLLPFNIGDVTGVELDRGGQTIVIDHQQGTWQIEKPAPYRASSNTVDSLLHDLVNAKFDTSATSEEAASSFAKAAPFETIKLTAGRGGRTETDTLELRKATTGGDFYGKASVFPGETWKLDPSVDSALTKDLDDFRNKQVFDFAFGEPLNINYHANGTNLTLVRSNADWFQNGTKMDLDSVEALVSALRGLAASKFVASGFAKPDVEIEVVSGDGKLVEKVQIQKTKDGAIAKREDGPTLYALGADTVNPVFSAASGVRRTAPVPAPAPARK
jgi:Domain of unknown function (DUF4340)